MKVLKNKYFFFSSIAILLVSASQVLFSLSIKYLIDALSLRDSQLFYQLFGFLVLAVIILLCGEYAQQLLSQRYILGEGGKCHHRKIKQLYAQQADLISSDDLSLISNDIEQLKDLYFESQLRLVQGLSSLLFSLIALFTLDFLTACIVFFLSCLPIVIPFLFEKKLSDLQEKISEKQASHLIQLRDFLDGIRVIKNSLSGSFYIKRMEMAYQEVSQSFMTKTVWSSLGNVLIGLSFYGLTLSILLIGGWQVFQGTQTVGSILAIYALSSDLVHPITLIASALGDKKSSQDLLKKFPEELVELNDCDYFQEDFEELVVQGLSCPVTAGKVIQFPDMVIKKGDKILVTGSNGVGKSTLLEVLTRYKAYFDGNILLNRLDYHSLTEEQVQSLMSYLPQKAYLFQDSILNNLTLYQPYDEKKLEELLQLVGLSERFPTLDSLNETVTTQNQLSGGQIQKISLVRGLLQNRPVLLLDEGLNALDSESFVQLEKYLLAQPKLTLIHVSHQSSGEGYTQKIKLVNE